MAVEIFRNPHKIPLNDVGVKWLHDDGRATQVHAAGQALLPGTPVELREDGSTGVIKWFYKTNITDVPTPFVVLNRPSMDQGITTATPIGSGVDILITHPGALVYGLILSGEVITFGTKIRLGIAGFEVATVVTAAAGVAVYQALLELNGGSAIGADTFCPILRVG